MKKFWVILITILISIDLSAQWVKVPFDTLADITEIQFMNSDTGWIKYETYPSIGYDAAVTYNKGQSWNFSDHFNSVYFIDAKHVWCTRSDTASHYMQLLYSTDAGRNWELKANKWHPDSRFYFKDSLVGWILSKNFSINSAPETFLYHTTDGGKTKHLVWYAFDLLC